MASDAKEVIRVEGRTHRAEERDELAAAMDHSLYGRKPSTAEDERPCLGKNDRKSLNLEW